MRRRQFVRSSVILALAANGAACSGGSSKNPANDADLVSRFAKYRAAPEPNGDLAKVSWPSFVTDAPPDVKRLYEFQITHGQLMRYIPCYCGCGQNAGHKSNRDCYVKRVNPDGSVVLDSMAPT